MKPITLGQAGPEVSPICLGTMTFGEQVPQVQAHEILDRALELGIQFIDTAEMYAVPPRRETFGATETIIGHWFATRPGVRRHVVLATKVAGPSRNMDWIRNGSSDLKPADIVQACDDSLRRLQTDVIDLYQIHWPNRNGPWFGAMYFDPAKDQPQTAIADQLQALAGLVKAGKVRYIGLSNETPWGVCEFIKVAEQLGLPRIVSMQNPYSLLNRSVDNALDETLYRSQVGLLAYSPLSFGILTGKYDTAGLDAARPEIGRLTRFASIRAQRWGRPEVVTMAREYNTLARSHGLTPTQMALAYCYRNWRVASTIIGATQVQHVEEAVAAWRTRLAPELLAQIDALRAWSRDPAQ